MKQRSLRDLWQSQLAGSARRTLVRVGAIASSEAVQVNLAEQLELLARLRGMLRRERLRGQSGHWTYDLARHRQLLSAYSALAQEMIADQLSQRTTYVAARQNKID